MVSADFLRYPSPPRLLDQVREVARLKHFSLSTEKSYVHYIRDFILLHNKRHPKEMGASEIRAYLWRLAINRNVASSTQTGLTNTPDTRVAKDKSQSFDASIYDAILRLFSGVGWRIRQRYDRHCPVDA